VLEDQREGWIRWRPELAESGEYEEVAEAIEEFVPPCNIAGETCGEWLKTSALRDYPYTATWILYHQGMIHGFFALRSSVISTTIQDGGREWKEPLPCSQVVWLCKRDGGKFHGRAIINAAIGRAQEVAAVQGNVALVIEPFDDDVAELLQSRHEFFRAAEHGHLWVPLYSRIQPPG
jgi:hypothetical protein